MKKMVRRAVLPVLAAVLVLNAAAGASSGYFTTYVTAQGGHTLALQDIYVIPHERVDQNVKHIWVENTGAVECWVRARAIAPTGVEITYSGEGWILGDDGWFYYNAVLQPGESTAELAASITMPKSSELDPIPEGTEMNVVVITECAKVLYDDNGAPYANWDLLVKEG